MNILKPNIKENIKNINNGIVPEGYKLSKIGIIPQDWNIKSLANINDISTGATPLRSRSEYFNGTIPWVKTTDLNNSLIFNTEEKITDKALEESAVKYVKKNSILIAMYGGFNQIGRTGLTKIECTTNQAISSFYVDEVNYNSEFVLHWLNSKRGWWVKFAASSRKDPNITKKDIEEFPIVSTSLNEQKRISSILSTWDKALELKQTLIEKKIEQKNGLMQRLLTGRLRLNGFIHDWEEVKLGDILNERKEIGYSHLELLSITSKDGVVRRNEIDTKDNSSEDKSKYKRICPLDIGYNTMRMWQGVSGVSEYEGIVSPAYTVLSPTPKVDSYYIGYLFKLPRVINLFWRYSQGLVDDTLNLKYENFKEIKLTIPYDISEQRTITKLLLSIDKEIKMYEQELEQIKLQKCGLMQLLLTGKVRVKC